MGHHVTLYEKENDLLKEFIHKHNLRLGDFYRLRVSNRESFNIIKRMFAMKKKDFKIRGNIEIELMPKSKFHFFIKFWSWWQHRKFFSMHRKYRKYTK